MHHQTQASATRNGNRSSIFAGLIGCSCELHESYHEKLGCISQGLYTKLVGMQFQNELLQMVPAISGRSRLMGDRVVAKCLISTNVPSAILAPPATNHLGPTRGYPVLKHCTCIVLGMHIRPSFKDTLPRWECMYMQGLS